MMHLPVCRPRSAATPASTRWTSAAAASPAPSPRARCAAAPSGSRASARRGCAVCASAVSPQTYCYAANEPWRCFTLSGEGPDLLLVERAYWHFQNLDNANQTTHSL